MIISEKGKPPSSMLSAREKLVLLIILFCILWALYVSFSVNFLLSGSLHDQYQRMAFTETVYHSGEANDSVEILFDDDSDLHGRLADLFVSYCYRRVVFLGPAPQLPYKNYTLSMDWGEEGDLRISISEHGLLYIDGVPHKTFPARRGRELFGKLEALFARSKAPGGV